MSGSACHEAAHAKSVRRWARMFFKAVSDSVAIWHASACQLSPCFKAVSDSVAMWQA